MRATVTFTVEADRPHEWVEMYGGEHEAGCAFRDFIMETVARIGGGCTAFVTELDREADR